MVEYNIVNAKLSNSQLKELKSAVKNTQGTTLRMDTRIENNLSTDIELYKAQII